MRIYNTSDKPFECTTEGTCFRILPPTGEWKVVREPYEVVMNSNGKSITRFRDKWEKVSEEGTNVNAIEVAHRLVPVILHKAAEAGLRDKILTENENVKSFESKTKEIEKKLAAKDEEIKRKDNELAMKVARLKQVEEEHFNKSAKK